MDFPQVHGRLSRTGSLLRLLNFDTDMQLEAPVPHERTRPGVLRKGKRQDNRWSPFAHWQDDPSFLLVDGLSGPLDRVEALRAPGVLHAHLGMLFAELAGGFNSTKKGAEKLLHRLGIEGELATRGALQVRRVWPPRMGQTCLLVQFHARVPDACRFHLRLLEATEERRREIGQAIHAHGLHINLFFSTARKTGICRDCVGSKPSGVAFFPSPERDGCSRSRFIAVRFHPSPFVRVPA